MEAYNHSYSVFMTNESNTTFHQTSTTAAATTNSIVVDAAAIAANLTDNATLVGVISVNQQNYSRTSQVSNSSLLGGRGHQPIPVETVVTGLIMLLVIVVTIVGNILVCLAVFLVKKLRRPCNYLLVSLAVSDLCVAILVMPMALLYSILGRWSLGNFMCDLWVSFDVLSCTASILNLCMISVDRYYAITKPLEYGVKRTPKRMILCVSLVWLGAACISLPPLLIIGNEHEVIEGVPHCVVCQNFGYQIYATLLSFYIPLTVMIVVYYKIFCAARRIVLEERRAQSHLETNHCFLEISVKNGDGPPESRLATSYETSPATSTPAGGARVAHHRTSNTSIATTCSVGPNNNNGNHANKPNNVCFTTSRPSNESQCPMLQSTKISQNAKSKTKMKGKKSMSNQIGRNSAATVHSANQTSSNTKKLRFQLAKERKASTTLGIIMSAFIVCWLPFFVLALVRPFLRDSKAIPNSLSSIFLWLGYANSLLNPIIYATLNRDFRRPFQQILFFRCGSLNHMMREEFYHSQYGDPDPPQHFYMTGGSPEKTVVQNLKDVDDDIEIINSSSIKNSIQISKANESFL